MPEYIDREDLVKHLDILYNRLCGKSPHFYYGFLTVLDYVKDFSAAEVAPVVHGRWVFVCEHGNRLDYECTNCRGHIQIIKEPDYIMAYKRCPNCGARMDGDER